jgi:hypothetical protein
MPPLLRETMRRAGLGPRVPQLGRCPVCAAPVTATQERYRMRGDWYVHRACASYRTRRDHVPVRLRGSSGSSAPTPGE